MSDVVRALVAVLFFAAPWSSARAETPVVVELFTSQGCSSCPPADAILSEIAARDDVIALSVHVDYWDYLGWRDSFGSPAHTARQAAYRDAKGWPSLYTPQAVVGGAFGMVGSKRGDIEAAIEARAALPSSVSVELSRAEGRIRCALAPIGAAPVGAVVSIVAFIDGREVEIARGENRGRRIGYRNVVTEWRDAGGWDGTDAAFLMDPPQGADGVAVIVQAGYGGAVLGAAKLDLN